jgi:hypothetical protein
MVLNIRKELGKFVNYMDSKHTKYHLMVTKYIQIKRVKGMTKNTNRLEDDCIEEDMP